SLKECCALQFDQLRCCFALALVLASQSFRFVIWKPLDLDASTSSEDLRCTQEVSTLDASNEVEHVATDAAPETFVYLLGRMHGEGWRLFGMKWAKPEKILAPLAEWDVLASQGHEVCVLPDCF